MKSHYQKYLAAQQSEINLVKYIKFALGLPDNEPVPEGFKERFQGIINVIRMVEEEAFSRGARGVQQDIITALDLRTLLGK